MLDFTRSDFGQIVSTYLKGKASRKEAAHGWEDTYEFNLFHIKVQVLTIPHMKFPAGHVVAGIWAVRFDGTIFSIWKRSGEGKQGLIQVLEWLQETLLGVSASFLDLCQEPLEPGGTSANSPNADPDMLFDFEGETEDLGKDEFTKSVTIPLNAWVSKDSLMQEIIEQNNTPRGRSPKEKKYTGRPLFDDEDYSDEP